MAGFVDIYEKLESFGLNVVKIDGHNFYEIEKAFKDVQQEKEKPVEFLQRR